MQTHLEPLAERAPGREWTENLARIEQTVVAITGGPPRDLRTLETDGGLVVLLTLALDGQTTLSEAHDEATAVSARIREALPRRRRRRGPHRAVTLFLRGIRILRSGSGSRNPGLGGQSLKRPASRPEERRATSGRG